MVHKVLKWATEEVDNPDLRDRAFMYWRMLAINPGVAGEIVLAEKPAITTDSDRMDRGALDQLLLHTGSLGSIYHKNPEVSRRSFFGSTRHFADLAQTFIRNAAGKALADSPALNTLSRQVLVPLTRAAVPVPVQVRGPGPQELSKDNTAPDETKPTPPVPMDSDDLLETSSETDHHGESDGEEEHMAAPSASVSDPYANLESVFGGYNADAPKPHSNDLLF